MKTLYLVRHAKADSSGNYPKDYYRPLTANGMTDAARMARNMANEGVKLDQVICSPAERTRQTAEIFSDQLHFDSKNIEFFENLYESRLLDYLTVINATSSSINTVMLIGHNPTISFLAEYLTGAEIGDVPTSGVITISFDGMEWTEISKKSGRLVKFESPNKTFGF